MILLRDLTAHVLQHVSDDPEGVGVSVGDIYACLDAQGDQNPHLKIRRVGRGPPRREQPLSGDEEVHGEYLLFVWCPHDQFIHLDEYKSKEGLEKILLSASGAFCPFLTYLVPFVKGKLAPFRISFRGNDGRIEYRPKYPWDKWPQYGPDALDQVFPNRKIEWLAV
jgi:hypothetical protein